VAVSFICGGNRSTQIKKKSGMTSGAREGSEVPFFYKTTVVLLIVLLVIQERKQIYAVILWRSVLFVEETGVHGENH
jgi:hypothetical protein